MLNITPLKIKQGEIWLANLNPQKGTEAGKTRPIYILQNQYLLDDNHPSTLIIRLTTKLINDAYPLRIRIKANKKLIQDSDLILDQIRAIDNKRLLEGPLVRCNKKFIHKVQDAVNNLIGTPSNLFKYSS